MPDDKLCPGENQTPQIVSNLDHNVKYINDLLGIPTTWDIIMKQFEFGNIRMVSYAANGYFLTMNMVLILESLHKEVQAFVQLRRDSPFTMRELVDYLSTHVAFVQVQTVPKMDDAVRFILSGPLMTFIDGFDEALLIDTRIYPMRSISEPDLERSIRGSRDAFTETMLMNTSMIRRRIRDPRLRDELMQIGDISKTDVSFLYMEGIADKALVDTIRNSLKAVQTDGLFMGEQALLEHIGRVKWNPYPIARYTQRPDVAATALVEGQILIVVDTSPDVMIAPTSFFHHLQHPQEYHSLPLVGTYFRWIILLAVILSVFLPGIFLLLNADPDNMPHWLAFFKAARRDPLPLWVELIIAEIALDLLRLSVTNSPKELASAVGIVAALLFGQFAAKIELLQEEVLVYMGLVMVAQLATSSYELANANQMARFWIIIFTAFFNGWGFLFAVVTWFLLLVTMKSFGLPYLWPLIPFRWKHGVREVLLRRPMQKVDDRASLRIGRRK
jgi:stage V sporulation protein AF